MRRVALFSTCMVDALYPGVAEAAVRLLEREGVEVIVPDGQTCCGQPAFNAGYRDEATAVARHLLDVFFPFLDAGTIEAVVAPSGSCVAMVRHGYHVLFAGPADSADAARVERLAGSTFELTEFLVDRLGIERTGARFEGDLTYHPCCHLLRELGVDEQPRRLLAGLADARIVPLPRREDCCGFGGLFAVKNAEISTAMGREKARHLDATGARTVAVSDVSCLTHLNGILERDGSRCRARHVAELLLPEDDAR